MLVCRYYFEDIVLSYGAALASQHHHQVHAAHAQHVPPAVHAGLDHRMVSMSELARLVTHNESSFIILKIKIIVFRACHHSIVVTKVSTDTSKEIN